MPISPARTAAFDILLRVEQSDAFAPELLHSSTYNRLTSSDHALATELVMGVLRWRSSIDRDLASTSSLKLEKLDPEVLTALRLAAYQLKFLDRIPGRAAVHESVELAKRARKRSAAAFVNAVLRKLSQQTAADVAKPCNPVDLSEQLAHPLWLVERWTSAFGFEVAQQICNHDQQIQLTVIRLGPGLASEAQLEEEGIQLGPAPLLAHSRTVVGGNVTRTRAFRHGKVAIQDEASQLVALLVGQGQNILDCCAAPGGKTRVMAQSNQSASIVAMELHPHRAALLQKLVSAPNVTVVAADLRSSPVGRTFDRVLADVPCSGTGTMAHNPEIKWRLKPEDLVDLQGRQVEILRAAMKHLAPGGRLVYSTCSLEREENEEVIDKAMTSGFQLRNAGDELRKLQEEDEIRWPQLDSLLSGPYLRTLPGVHPCDGFFAAILERQN
jgi:16S rRNA (cytosine967-C5)-methyltransferase